MAMLGEGCKRRVMIAVDGSKSAGHAFKCKF